MSVPHRGSIWFRAEAEMVRCELRACSRLIGVSLVALTVAASALAAITPDSPGGGSVQFSVNSTQNVKPISQYIYGINFSNNSTLEVPVTLDRLGGNRWTGYNWETNASNAGRDWYFQNDDHMGNGPPGNAVKSSLTGAANQGRGLIVTVPISGYVAGDANRTSVTLAQALDKSRFKEIVPVKGSPLSLTPNTGDGVVYTDEFVNWVEQNRANNQTVFYSLDNEPGLWGETLPANWKPGVPPPCPPCNVSQATPSSPEGRTHGALHPYAPTYTELRDKTIANAAAIKNVNPNAMVFGGVGYGWQDFVSLQDAPDRNTVPNPSHPGGDEPGEMHFYEYLLKEVATAEQQQGRKLMDVLDFHWYPEATGGGVRITGNNNTAAVAAARVQAPRSLWDPTYTETSWITQYSTNIGSTPGPIKLLPRAQRDINDFKPDTKISITEYNYGGTNHISGAIAQADALGIFGDQNVFAATLWPLDSDANSQFVEGAFKMYLNYNGTGGKYGDMSVASTTNNLNSTSIHASVDSTNPNRMVVVAINRTGSPVTTGIALTHDRVFDHAEIYQLTSGASGSNPYTISHPSDIELNLLNAFQYTLPANSISTLVLISDGLPGDFNHDGAVDGADYVVWRNLEGSAGNDLAADANEDNVVDANDYSLWSSNFGRTNLSGAGSVVPEPASLALILISAMAFSHRSRRHT
jgi:hypothetical protein